MCKINNHKQIKTRVTEGIIHKDNQMRTLTMTFFAVLTVLALLMTLAVAMGAASILHVS